ncbi:MAG: DUF3822 family protein [Saprospiraceae bacterium]|nr:DUF3822 family protein [Saprospiraceae bacterium]
MPVLNFDYLKHEDIHKLSVVITADSFVYGVFDHSNQLVKVQFINNVNYSDPHGTTMIREMDILKLTFQEIIVCSKQLPALHMNVPDDELFNYFPSFQDKVVFKEKFTGIETYAYFGLNEGQVNLLTDIFPDFQLHHYSKVLGHYYYPSFVPVFLAHFDEKNLHVFYQNESGFRFYNSFVTTSAHDSLYFILSAYKYLGLDPLKEKLTLSGLVDKTSPLYKLLHGYIAYPEFAVNEGLKFGNSAVESQKHYYLDIFATSLCGS